MKLILENWRKFVNEVSLGSDMAKSIQYTGFVLDPDHEGTIKLKDMVPEGWKEYAHHMTMIPPPKMKQRLPTGQFFEGCLKVVGVAINDKVMAAKVDIGDKLLYFKIEGVPHVTIATAIDPVKTKEKAEKTKKKENSEEEPEPVYYSPSLSNEFTDDDFTEPADFEICGKVEEVPPMKETIKKVDGKHVVYPKKGGKRLGTHTTKEKAQKQLAAIEISKNKK